MVNTIQHDFIFARQDKPVTPAEQYQSLLEELGLLPDESSRAKTAEEGESV